MDLQMVRSVCRSRRGRLSMVSAASMVGMGLVVGSLYAGAPVESVREAAAAGSERGESETSTPELDEIEDRIRRLTGGWAELNEYYRTTVAPLERVLLTYGADPELAEQVAVALVRESNAVEMEPRLLLAVLLVENPWLDPVIRSPVGAVGLMQVMPFHEGQWPACEPDLEDVDANICHGVRIFAYYFRQTGGNLERALLRYNGCVRGTNTPDCHQYPYHVFARAGQASLQAWADD